MNVLNLLATGYVGGTEMLNLTVARYAAWDNYTAFLFDGGAVADRMPAGRTIRIGRGNRNRLSPRILRTLLSYCRERRIDVVCLQHESWLTQRLFLQLKKRMPGIRYVAFLHSCFDRELYYGNPGVRHMLKKHYLQRMLQSADCLVTVSQAGKRSFLSAFPWLGGKPFHIVYNGVGPDWIREGGTNVPRPGRPAELLYIGRLTGVKGVDRLIDAVAALAPRYSLHLTIVGDGEEAGALKARARRAGVADRVTFTGVRVDREQFLKRAQLFVYPSVWQEVFGISVVEAMAYGLPCIANRVGGIPEILADGVNGFFPDSPDARGLAGALARALDSMGDGSYAALSQHAKETARKFSILSTVGRMREIYEHLMQAPPRSLERQAL